MRLKEAYRIAGTEIGTIPEPVTKNQRNGFRELATVHFTELF